MPRRRIMQVRYFQLLLLHDPMAMLCYSCRSATKRYFKAYVGKKTMAEKQCHELPEGQQLEGNSGQPLNCSFS